MHTIEENFYKSSNKFLYIFIDYIYVKKKKNKKVKKFLHPP